MTLPTGPSEIQFLRASVWRNEDILQFTAVWGVFRYVFCSVRVCWGLRDLQWCRIACGCYSQNCKLYNRRWFEVTVQTSAESESPRQTYINIQTQTDAGCLKQCWITVTQLQSIAPHTHRGTHKHSLVYINSQVQSSSEVQHFNKLQIAKNRY